MTQETLEKANQILKELDQCKRYLVTIKHQLEYGVNTESLNSYIRHGGNHSVEIPRNLNYAIAQIIKEEYEKRIAELKKQLDEL